MKKNLHDWLTWQESLHLSEIDLGLERIGSVAQKMGLLKPDFAIITVAGTNGKGSTVAFLDNILRESNYKTGAFTSPHLEHYNERIVLNGVQADDEDIIEAFEKIDQARKNISLTYFEFSALAAIYIYQKYQIDIAILEVGLGGRLDAANLWDANLAIITSIGVDHIDWLGDDRELIAIEKSGIMRKNTPVICGDQDPPTTIKSEALRIGAKLQQINIDFSYEKKKRGWQWSQQENTLSRNQSAKNSSNHALDLELPRMAGEFQLNNAATAIAGLLAIEKQFPISLNDINKGLKNASVTGRLQVINASPEWLIDVAHNPHAAKQLSKYLETTPVQGKTYALFSMLRDKDITQVLNIMGPNIDEWHIVATQGTRGLSLNELKQQFQRQNPEAKVISYENFNDACKSLKNKAKDKDRVVAFGSFLVISEILDNCN